MLAENAFADTYIPAYTQPPGIRATYHVHDKPIGFKSMTELQEHWQREHVGKQK